MTWTGINILLIIINVTIKFHIKRESITSEKNILFSNKLWIWDNSLALYKTQKYSLPLNHPLLRTNQEALGWGWGVVDRGKKF